MAGPASFPTAQRIIQFAMRDAGLLGEGEEPNSTQLAENLVRLNDLVNLWQTQGLKLFLWQDIGIPLVAGQNFYSIGPAMGVNMTKPLRGLQAYFLDSNNIRRPLVVLSWDDYMRLSQVTQSGSINSYFIDKQSTYLNLFLWLAPDATDATGTAHLLFQTQTMNSVSLTDAVAFPQEWFLALRWGLADDICTGQPPAIMQRCQVKAQGYREALEGWDVEDAPTYFAPDIRMGYSQGSFR
jgi:hypothetical protein